MFMVACLALTRCVTPYKYKKNPSDALALFSSFARSSFNASSQFCADKLKGLEKSGKYNYIYRRLYDWGYNAYPSHTNVCKFSQLIVHLKC